MMNLSKYFIALSAFFIIAIPAQAEFIFMPTDAEQRTINAKFSGTVTTDILQNLTVFRDGKAQPYTGPDPDFPYKLGDPIDISFTTTMPTAAYYANNGINPANGVAETILFGPLRAGASPFGLIENFAISGPLGALNTAEHPLFSGGLIAKLNLATGGYSLASLPNLPPDFVRGWVVANIDGPTLGYDSVSNMLKLLPATCIDANCSNFINGTGASFRGFIEDNNAFNGKFTISAFDGINREFFGSSTSTSSSGGGFAPGSLNLSVSGDYSLSSPPVSVPAPSMLLIFGFGAGAMAFARRRRVRRA